MEREQEIYRSFATEAINLILIDGGGNERGDARGARCNSEYSWHATWQKFLLASADLADLRGRHGG